MVERLECARREREFQSLDDFMRRVAPKKDELDALAEAGALELLVKGRRQALWQVRTPQMSGLFERTTLQEPQAKLPALRDTEQLILDYGSKGLCVSDHPLRHLRARLSKRKVVRAADLVHLNKGVKVSVAGLVLSRQRPGTASGVVFVTLEDETGHANLILYRHVFERYHWEARHSTLLLAHGEVEREVKLRDTKDTPVIHVIVQSVERLDVPGRSLGSMSRDFH
jgi:error-prone DNA polymerase